MVFFEIQASRIRVARLFLALGIVVGITATISSLHMGMMGEALGGISAIIITPIVLWLSTKPRFKYLPNIAAVLISAAFSIGSAFTMLEHSEGMVWMGVTPIMYFYLSNRYLGLVLAIITLASFMISYVTYPALHGVEPVSIGVFGQAMSVFLYSTLLAWLYETEWTGKYHSLKQRSDLDYLTGIYTRRAIVRHMEMTISDQRREKLPMCVILFDLDNFKSINDTYGHDVGDHVLKEMVDTVKVKIRREDIFGRWGGEEFIIVCHCTLEEGMQFAEKVRTKISEHKFKQIKQLTSSFGVVQYSGDVSISEMMNRVDEYLYVAKKTKNCVVIEEAPDFDNAGIVYSYSGNNQ